MYYNNWISQIMLKPDRFSCSQKICLKRDPPVYFNLNDEAAKENCKFKFHYNKIDITPTVLDGGNEIILPNWPSDKHIICNINNDILIKISSSHSFMLVNIIVLCNCGIEAENHFLLESLATCQDTN